MSFTSAAQSLPSHERSLAGPLMSRQSKTKPELCESFKTILLSSSIESDHDEGYAWELLRILASNVFSIPQRFSSLQTSDQPTKTCLVLLNWIQFLYRTMYPGQASDSLGYEKRAFDLLLRGDDSKFLSMLKEVPADWKIVTFAGAFSSYHYPLWKKSVKQIIDCSEPTSAEIDLYLALCGDQNACKKLVSAPQAFSFFSSVWAAVFSFLSDALCGNPIRIGEVSASMPIASSFLEIVTFDVVSGGFEKIIKDDRLSISFRARVSAIFQTPIDSSTLESYIDYLISKKALGLAIFYSSLSDYQSGIELIVRILAGIPTPERRPLDIAENFKFVPLDVATHVADRMIHSSIEDFEAKDLSTSELADRRISSLDWIFLAASSPDYQQRKVRELLTQFSIEDEFEGGSKLLQKHCKLISDQREAGCWKALFDAEISYLKGEAAEAQLLSVLRFSKGWMNGCKSVDAAVGEHCIPLVAEQLFDLYMKEGKYELAMGISVLLCDNAKNLKVYFSKDSWRHFLGLMKKAGIESLRRNQQH